jgi:hypothetical protein
MRIVAEPVPPLVIEHAPPSTVMATGSPEGDADASTLKLVLYTALPGADGFTVIVWFALCAVVALVTSGAAL